MKKLFILGYASRLDKEKAMSWSKAPVFVEESTLIFKKEEVSHV